MYMYIHTHMHRHNALTQAHKNKYIDGWIDIYVGCCMDGWVGG